MREAYRSDERAGEDHKERNPDARWMRQALQLAEASIGLASPNPRVGCILVRNGLVVGRGAHRYDEKDHAEIVALKDAGSQAYGATAYVTLEPCSHTGRTPPCAEALIRAGVSRVVVATGDPNPLVSGRGIAMLREAGVAVTLGVLADQARALNDGFARWIRRKRPFVTLKAGVSLDGRIAPPPNTRHAGRVSYLTSARSLLAVQKLRHSMDAVLTGIGTVLEDNPMLTDRSGGARRRALLRIVLDSRLRLPTDCRLLQTAQNDLLLITSESSDAAHAGRRKALEAAGARVQTVGRGRSGELNLHAVMRLLAESYQVLNLLTEGGSQLNRSLLEASDVLHDGAHLVDKLCLFYAPMFLGDAGVPLVAGGLALPTEVRRSSISESGSDFRLDAYLRDPWRDP